MYIIRDGEKVNIRRLGPHGLNKSMTDPTWTMRQAFDSYINYTQQILDDHYSDRNFYLDDPEEYEILLNYFQESKDKLSEIQLDTPVRSLREDKTKC